MQANAFERLESELRSCSRSFLWGDFSPTAAPDSLPSSD